MNATCTPALLRTRNPGGRGSHAGLRQVSCLSLVRDRSSTVEASGPTAEGTATTVSLSLRAEPMFPTDSGTIQRRAPEVIESPAAPARHPRINRHPEEDRLGPLVPWLD